MPKELEANVLLVDDEEQFLNIFSQRLQSRGLRVETAASGEDALKRVKSKEFDTIVLDLVMPGLSGIETLKRLRSENPDLQIIILTGHGTLEKGIEAMKAGAVDFIEKPVYIDKILEKVAEAKRKRILLIEKKHEDHIKEILRSKGW